jgi:dTDP-4-amino-4,6-dideoxygalactose transaminase
MQVPLLDLKVQFSFIKDEIMKVTEELFDSQQFILGPKVEALEKKIADYCQCRFAVGVSSGTDALILSLMGAGIGRGDLVITTPYSFFATAGSIARLGALPTFVDIDRETYNLDPKDLDRKISSMSSKEKSRLKAAMPVHLYGQCADMDPILDVAAHYGFDVIEDAAQALGAEYACHDGRKKRAGSMGNYGCFSFFPSKNLGAFGDGGMVTTNEEGVYERLKIMRVHGSKPKYHHRIIGGNFRLDALQAAVLIVKLKYLEQWTEGRIANAGRYRSLFEASGVSGIELPTEKGGRHIYNQFVIRVPDRRDELKAYLNDRGVGCEIYYPVPLHLQECFRYLRHDPGDFPVSEEAAERTLALPVYPELTSDQIEYVTDIIVKFYKS